MAGSRSIEVYSLNLAASPHPAGIYIKLLRKASEFIVKVRGSDYAKITTPRKYERQDGFYTGRILVWTEIDFHGQWLDLGNEDVLPKNLHNLISIPPSAKPNYRVFNYVFYERQHRLYFEGSDEFGKTFGAITGKRLFGKLLSQELMGRDSPEVAVSLIPEESAVDRILSTPHLRTLTIRITRPNADVTSSPARTRLFRQLDAANAKQMEVTYTKAAGKDSLVATPEIRDLAEVGGSGDGFVFGAGRGVNAKRLEVSTNDLPKKHILSLDDGGSFIARLLVAIRLR